MKDDFYGKKQPFRSPWWLIGAAVLLIAVAAALLWPSESLAPAQEEQTQSAAADQAARLEDGAELFQRFTCTRCDHVVTRRVTAPVELYGKTLEEAQPLYPEWRITEFSPKALRMERQVPLFCPDHQVLMPNAAGTLCMALLACARAAVCLPLGL